MMGRAISVSTLPRSRPSDDADEGQQQHLGEEVDQDARTGGAEALHGGDGALPLGDIGGDRVGDADAADQQRGQPDDDEEAREDVEEARQVGGGVLRAS